MRFPQPGSYIDQFQLLFLYTLLNFSPVYLITNMKVVFAQVVALAVGASAFNGEIRTLGASCRAWEKWSSP